MIKNGVKYGMMNGVKWHPLGPSFAVAAAGLHRRHTATGAPRGTMNYSTAAAKLHWSFAHRPPRGPASPQRVRNRTASQRLCLVKVGSHSTAATNRRSRGVPSVLPTARQSMNSYSESTRPRRRCSLH